MLGVALGSALILTALGGGWFAWQLHAQDEALRAADVARAGGDAGKAATILESWFRDTSAPNDRVRVRLALVRRLEAERLSATADFPGARRAIESALAIAVPGCLERPAVEDVSRQVDLAEAKGALARNEFEPAAGLLLRAGKKREAFDALARAGRWEQLQAAAQEHNAGGLVAEILRGHGKLVEAARMLESMERWDDAAVAWTEAGQGDSARAAWKRALAAATAAKSFSGLISATQRLTDATLRRQVLAEVRPTIEAAGDASALAAFLAAAGENREAAGIYEKLGQWRAAVTCWEQLGSSAEVYRLLAPRVRAENDPALTLQAVAASRTVAPGKRSGLLAVAMEQALARGDTDSILRLFASRGEPRSGVACLLELAQRQCRSRPFAAKELVERAGDWVREDSNDPEARQLYRKFADVRNAVARVTAQEPEIVHARSSLTNHFNRYKQYDGVRGTIVVRNRSSARLRSVRIEVSLTGSPPLRSVVELSNIAPGAFGDARVELQPREPMETWTAKVLDFSFAP